MIQRWWPLLALLFVFSACQSLQKLYDEGAYEKAHKAALRKLQDKPGDQEALKILEDALGQLLQQDRSTLTELRQTQDATAWEKALKIIAKDRDRIAQSSPYLGTRFDAQANDLDTVELELREDLYDLYLAVGKTRLEEAVLKDDAAIALQAYRKLQSAQDYSEPHFPEVGQLPDLLQRAEEVAIVYYQVEINDGFNIGLGVDIDGMFANLEQQSTRFRQIEVVFIANGGDCDISIDFGEFEAVIEEDVETREFETDIVADYETEVDTAGNEIEIPVYETVFGQVEIVTSRKIGQWRVDVDVSSNTNNCSHFGNRYEDQIISEIEIFRTKGDERAIPREYQNSSIAEEHPDDEEMAEELLEYFYRQICGDYFFN